jgi:tetratricopeptide (TPR) repeat protein
MKAEKSAGRAAELNPAYRNAQANLSLDSYNSARYEELVGERSKPDVAESGTLAHYNLGLAFRQKALYDEALREFRLATERGEDKLLVQQAEAEMLLLRGDTQAATDLYEELVKEEPNSPKLWNELGVARHQAGKLDEAERSYRQSLDLDPDYALAWNNLAVVRHHRGDAHESESAFRAALAHGRAIADVWRNMGLMLSRAGRAEHALDAYKRALEADPDSAVAYAGLGITLMDAGRPADAKAALVRAVELDPTLPEARYHLAFALSALGDYQGALRETKHALDLNPYIPQPRYKLLIDLQFEEASVLAPELDSAQRVMAPVGESIPQFEFNAASLDAAFTAALPHASDEQQAVSLAAETPAGPDAAELLESARAAFEQGKLDEANELAQRALRAGADRREFLLLQGDIYVRRDFPGEAVERYTAVLGEVSAHGDPASENAQDIVRRALSGAASCFIELGRMAEAVEAAERLSALSPNDGNALRLLGRALARVNDHPRAIVAFEQALDAEGESASLLTELGAAYQAGGKLQAAEESLRRALELDEFAIGGRVLLGRLLIAGGRIDDAASELRAALDFLPSHGDAAFALADLERSRGRTRAAIGVLIDLLSVDPYHLDALVKLGALLAEGGRLDDAQHALQRVLRFDPGHAAAQRLLGALSSQPAMQAS